MDLNIRREMFVNEIRKSQKLKIRKEMRKNIFQISQIKPQGLKETESMKFLISQCEKGEMTEENINLLLQSFRCCNVYLLAEQRNILLLKKMIEAMKVKSNQQVMSNLYEKLRMILSRIICSDDQMLSEGSEGSEVMQDVLMNNCYTAILSLMESQMVQLFVLWKKISLIRNQLIQKTALKVFLRVVESLKQLKEEHISIIIQSIYNFSDYDEQGFVQFAMGIKCLAKLSMIIRHFDLVDEDVFKVNKTVMNAIGKKTKETRILAIINTCDILTNVFQYLSPQLSPRLSIGTIIHIVKLVSKAYGTTRQTSQKVFEKHNKIVQYLRYCIPVPDLILLTPNTPPQFTKPPNPTLMKNIVFALSNIVASSDDFVEYCIKTDMYKCLRFLYFNCDKAVKEQVTFVYLNMLLLCHSTHFKVMLGDGLIEMLEIISKEPMAPMVQENGMRMLDVIALKVRTFNWRKLFNDYTLRDYKGRLQSSGHYQYIESILTRSENGNTSKYANQFLDHINWTE